jgi:hypothetical protein
MILGVATVSTLMIGFLAGLLTFKRSQQWCARCGATKKCPDPVCTGSPARVNAGHFS